MLGEIIIDPRLERFACQFTPGQVIFYEDDPSQDLYILVQGEVEVLKGKTKIAQFNQPGAIFGEMSFLLGSKRTATLRALGPVRALRVPQDEIDGLVQDIPHLAREITRLLAQRLEETSQTLHGLKELGDHLPDAVVCTDEQGAILAFNLAAQQLYGRQWPQVRGQAVEDMYADPEAFRRLLAEVRSRQAVREALLAVKHPTRGLVWVSTSLNALYDPQHNFQGVLSLGRDVTAAEGMKKRLRTLRNWLIPVGLLCALLAGAAIYAYPYLTRGVQAVDAPRQDLRNQLARDYLLLKAQVMEALAARDRASALRPLKEFLTWQQNLDMPYVGLVLLDRDKEVLAAQGINDGNRTDDTLGSSYAHIKFQGDDRSPHRVLTLYRRDKTHSMGRKDIELAFEIKKGGQLAGWLVFQMDVAALQNRYGLDEEGLKALRFPNS